MKRQRRQPLISQGRQVFGFLGQIFPLQPLEEADPADTSTLPFQPLLQPCKYTFLMFKPPNLWYCVLVALANYAILYAYTHACAHVHTHTHGAGCKNRVGLRKTLCGRVTITYSREAVYTQRQREKLNQQARDVGCKRIY